MMLSNTYPRNERLFRWAAKCGLIVQICDIGCAIMLHLLFNQGNTFYGVTIPRLFTLSTSPELNYERWQAIERNAWPVLISISLYTAGVAFIICVAHILMFKKRWSLYHGALFFTNLIISITFFISVSGPYE